jgi:hypothetical protein
VSFLWPKEGSRRQRGQAWDTLPLVASTAACRWEGRLAASR